MDLSTAIALVGAVGAIATIIAAFIGYRRGIKQEGAGEGSLRSDVGYIKAGVDDVKSELKEQRDKHFALAEKVAAIDQSTRSAHHRIDGLEDDIDIFLSNLFFLHCGIGAFVSQIFLLCPLSNP